MSDRLSEIRARLDRATGGQWLHGVQEGFHWVDTCPDRRVVTIADDVPTDADAELIAHAPGDIRWLLDAVDEVRRIHEPVEALEVRSQRVGNVCAGCGTDDGNWVAWPCPTLRALGVES